MAAKAEEARNGRLAHSIAVLFQRQATGGLSPETAANVGRIAEILDRAAARKARGEKPQR